MMQITELGVWKAAIDLAKSCYELSQKFPEVENFGLGYQLRSTVTNIPANVSAAASRKHGKESLRHLFRARDMIYEVESHVYLAQKMGYISEEELESMLESLNTSKRLLFGFIKYYKRAGSYGNKRRGRHHKHEEEEHMVTEPVGNMDDSEDEDDDEF